MSVRRIMRIAIAKFFLNLQEGYEWMLQIGPDSFAGPFSKTRISQTVGKGEIKVFYHRVQRAPLAASGDELVRKSFARMAALNRTHALQLHLTDRANGHTEVDRRQQKRNDLQSTRAGS